MRLYSFETPEHRGPISISSFLTFPCATLNQSLFLYTRKHSTQKNPCNLRLLYFLTRGTCQQTLHVPINPLSNWADIMEVLFRCVFWTINTDAKFNYTKHPQELFPFFESFTNISYIIQHKTEKWYIFFLSLCIQWKKQVYIYFYKVQLTRH